MAKSVVATPPKQREEPCRDILSWCIDDVRASAAPCFLRGSLPNTNDNATDSKNAAQKNTSARTWKKTDAREAGKQVRPHSMSVVAKCSPDTFHSPPSQASPLPWRNV